MMETLMDRLPVTHFILSLTLPAGDWADTKERWRWPNGLSPGIISANVWLKKAFSIEKRVTVLDCGPHFLPTGLWVSPYPLRLSSHLA
jgi:hypothetical protein